MATLEPTKTVISNPYRRRRQDDLEKLEGEIKEYDDKVDNPETTESEEAQNDSPSESKPDPSNAEEVTFAKRYGDLRRFHDTKVKELEDQLKQKEEELQSVAQRTMELPHTKEELEAWKKQNPQVYAIIRTIAGFEAEERKKSVDDRMKVLEQREMKSAYTLALQELLKVHPDAEQLRKSPEFHAWAEAQTKEVQDWLYRNPTDWQKAARAIDLYKFDNDRTSSKKKKEVEASKTVNTKKTVEPRSDDKKTWTRAEIAKMSQRQYEKIEDELMLALQEGRILN